MSSQSTKRAVSSVHSFAGWSAATVVSAILAGCGGGGGDGGTTPPPPPPPAPTNVAPTANAGPAVTITMPTDTATWTGSATDDGLPTGSSIGYTWEYVSGPTGPNNAPGATLNSTNTAATGARFIGGAGEYTFNLKASDGTLTGNSTLKVTVAANPNTYPSGTGWEIATPASVNMTEAKLDEARDYSLNASINNSGPGSEAGYVIRGGKLVYSWGNVATRYEVKSTTKSIGGLALLLALDEGKLALADKVQPKLPVFGTDPAVDLTAVTTGGLADISVLQLATHTAGFSKSDAAASLRLLFTPGTTWSYSDQGLNWLADLLTQTYAQDLNALMTARVFTTLGITTTDLTWRTNAFRSATLSVNGTPVQRRELASGINANVNAMARVGLLMLRKGAWGNQQLLSNAIVAKATTPPAEVAGLALPDPVNYPGATTNYGILWWTNKTGQIPGLPTDAYWAWGLHETFIIVIPSLDIVVARAGDHAWNSPTDSEFWNADYSRLAPFITPIVQSVTP